MPRKGRGLEQLVAMLEESLGEKGIQVKSPDYIKDKDTGEDREVDVSLRAKVGSFEVLAIIECRDRDDTEDVRWIEEIATKCKSVGADKVMAVSSEGFTAPAIKKAEKLNIGVRILNDFNPAEIGEWFKCNEGIYFDPNAIIFDLVIETGNGDKIDAKGIDLDSPLFERIDDGRHLSFKEIWQSIPKPAVYSGVPEDGSHIQVCITLDYHPDDQDKPNVYQCIENVRYIKDQVKIDVKKMYIGAELWQDVKRVPYIVRRYESPDGSIAEIAEFEYEDKGKLYNIGIFKNGSSDKAHIYLMPKGHEVPGRADFKITLRNKLDETQSRDYIGKL